MIKTANGNRPNMITLCFIYNPVPYSDTKYSAESKYRRVFVLVHQEDVENNKQMWRERKRAEVWR